MYLNMYIFIYLNDLRENLRYSRLTAAVAAAGVLAAAVLATAAVVLAAAVLAAAAG